MSNKLRAPIKELFDASLEEARVQRMWRDLQERPARKSKLRRGWVAGATAAVVLGALGVLRTPDMGPLVARDASALAFDRANTVLSDGSQIELATGTTLDLVENNGQSFVLRLERGRARFDVTPGGPRRWRMDCGLASVTVVGTALTIERGPTTLHVEVAHGVVEVRGEHVPGGPRRLTAGQSLFIEGPHNGNSPPPTASYAGPEKPHRTGSTPPTATASAEPQAPPTASSLSNTRSPALTYTPANAHTVTQRIEPAADTAHAPPTAAPTAPTTDARSQTATTTDARTSTAPTTDARMQTATTTDARTSTAPTTDARSQTATTTDARTSTSPKTDARMQTARTSTAPTTDARASTATQTARTSTAPTTDARASTATTTYARASTAPTTYARTQSAPDVDALNANRAAASAPTSGAAHVPPTAALARAPSTSHTPTGHADPPTQSSLHTRPAEIPGASASAAQLPPPAASISTNPQAPTAQASTSTADAPIQPNVAQLLLEADLARQTGAQARALTILRQLLREHSGTSEAGIAGFTLARMQMEQDPRAAAEALRSSLTAAIPESLREDALARLVEAYARAGDPALASSTAAEYRRKYPSGRRLAEVERWAIKQ